MRVLVVTPWFPSDSAPGSGIFNLRDVELLAQDHEVRVLHLCAPPLLDAQRVRALDGVTVEQVPYSLARPATILPAVRSIRRALADAELLHTMAFPALFPAARARPRVPWMHTEHWSGLVRSPHSLRARAGRAVLARGLRRPSQVVAVSQPLAQAVSRVRRSPVDVIPNHVRIVTGGAPEPPEGRGDSALRLIGVGNLVPGKGPVEAVDAVAALRRHGILATLRWAGVGALDREVLERADRLGISSHVELLGHLGPADLSNELLGSHVFLLPTEGETFGVAIAEALGHGLPVVTSGTGGHLDFLPVGASRLVSERSGPALAEAVEDLIADPSRWPPERIQGFARERFSEATRHTAYARTYEAARHVHRRSLLASDAYA